MKVLVIDNYDSFVYNLVQYVGEQGAAPTVYRNDALTLQAAQMMKPDRIIISPGPGTPEDPRYFGVCLEIIREMGPKTPILGVCLGHQGIAYAYGGRVVKAKNLMHGKTSIIKHDCKAIFKGIANPVEATRYHSLAADKATLPKQLRITASTLDDGEIMGIRHVEYPVEGVQFHPESIATREGMRMIRNFLNGD
ncbi:MAG: aminodeoxychorismate/anthranilate synthase component II [Thaumarchaeota archaeon]|nr:aminodeoxychorismate/anthranilate synthase component II [Nitrososphaerota archaeon]